MSPGIIFIVLVAFVAWPFVSAYINRGEAKRLARFDISTPAKRIEFIKLHAFRYSVRDHGRGNADVEQYLKKLKTTGIKVTSEDPVLL